MYFDSLKPMRDGMNKDKEDEAERESPSTGNNTDNDDTAEEWRSQKYERERYSSPWSNDRDEVSEKRDDSVGESDPVLGGIGMIVGIFSSNKEKKVEEKVIPERDYPESLSERDSDTNSVKNEKSDARYAAIKAKIAERKAAKRAAEEEAREKRQRSDEEVAEWKRKKEEKKKEKAEAKKASTSGSGFRSVLSNFIPCISRPLAPPTSSCAVLAEPVFEQPDSFASSFQQQQNYGHGAPPIQTFETQVLPFDPQLEDIPYADDDEDEMIFAYAEDMETAKEDETGEEDGEIKKEVKFNPRVGKMRIPPLAGKPIGKPRLPSDTKERASDSYFFEITDGSFNDPLPLEEVVEEGLNHDAALEVPPQRSGRRSGRQNEMEETTTTPSQNTLGGNDAIPEARFNEACETGHINTRTRSRRAKSRTAPTSTTTTSATTAAATISASTIPATTTSATTTAAVSPSTIPATTTSATTTAAAVSPSTIPATTTSATTTAAAISPTMITATTTSATTTAAAISPTMIPATPTAIAPTATSTTKRTRPIEMARRMLSSTASPIPKRASTANFRVQESANDDVVFSEAIDEDNEAFDSLMVESDDGLHGRRIIPVTRGDSLIREIEEVHEAEEDNEDDAEEDDEDHEAQEVEDPDNESSASNSNSLNDSKRLWNAVVGVTKFKKKMFYYYVDNNNVYSFYGKVDGLVSCFKCQRNVRFTDDGFLEDPASLTHFKECVQTAENIEMEQFQRLYMLKISCEKEEDRKDAEFYEDEYSKMWSLNFKAKLGTDPGFKKAIQTALQTPRTTDFADRLLHVNASFARFFIENQNHRDEDEVVFNRELE